MAQTSRRALLTSGVAALAGATSVGAVAAAPAAPDPIFALIEAERVAWAAWGLAIDEYGAAEAAVFASEFNRAPRVLIGEYTSMVRGPDFDPIPLAEQVAEPVYAYDHEAIDRDCDDEQNWHGSDLVQVEARRARLHRQLDEDAAAIEAAPVKVRESETEAYADRMCNLATEAFEAICLCVPTTQAGFLAALSIIETRAVEEVHAGTAEHLAWVLAMARAFVGRAGA